MFRLVVDDGAGYVRPGTGSQGSIIIFKYNRV